MLNYPQTCEFQDLDSRKTIANARENGGLYYFEGEGDPSGKAQHSSILPTLALVANIMIWLLQNRTPRFSVFEAFGSNGIQK